MSISQEAYGLHTTNNDDDGGGSGVYCRQNGAKQVCSVMLRFSLYLYCFRHKSALKMWQRVWAPLRNEAALNQVKNNRALYSATNVARTVPPLSSKIGALCAHAQHIHSAKCG